MIRFYAPQLSADEALDVRVPRQKDRITAEEIGLDAAVAPDPASLSEPG